MIKPELLNTERRARMAQRIIAGKALGYGDSQALLGHVLALESEREHRDAVVAREQRHLCAHDLRDTYCLTRKDREILEGCAVECFNAKAPTSEHIDALLAAESAPLSGAGGGEDE